MSDDLRRAVERVLYLEGHYLDLQRWKDWLALFAPDAIYWVPAWKSEHETTNAPDTEMSLIYYTNRRNLEDRVIRATAGTSAASTPLPRTVHAVTNIFISKGGAAALHVQSTWTTHIYQPSDKRTTILFGRGEHILRNDGNTWLIAQKKTIIVNEVIPSVVDFYHL
jgi:3-phenylpropionate/cinnamic acid dioxygenase small subunit